MPDLTDGPTIVYIHGAGPQAGEDDLKADFNDALFPGEDVKSDVPRYAHVFWEQTLDGSSGSDLEARLDAIATGGEPPVDAANAVLEVVASRRLEGMKPPADLDDARRLVADWFREADELEKQSQHGAAERIPEWAFRKLAARASADVVAYLYEDWRPLMQDPVLQRLGKLRDPFIIVAHSLGSILGYELLCRPDFADRDIRLLVTAGSPLGIDNVRKKLNENTGPRPLPRKIQRWSNFTDWHDLVPALGQQLAPFYGQRPPLDDHIVDNRCRNNHDLVGYLRVKPLRDVVRPFRAGI